MVTREGNEFVIVGPKGTIRIAPSRGTLELTRYEVNQIGISGDYEPLYDALWALCRPGDVDKIEFWWRANDPGEMNVVRER